MYAKYCIIIIFTWGGGLRGLPLWEIGLRIVCFVLPPNHNPPITPCKGLNLRRTRWSPMTFKLKNKILKNKSYEVSDGIYTKIWKSWFFLSSRWWPPNDFKAQKPSKIFFLSLWVAVLVYCISKCLEMVLRAQNYSCFDCRFFIVGINNAISFFL